jgi:diguanylate cyclase (GGDEF)-like protein
MTEPPTTLRSLMHRAHVSLAIGAVAIIGVVMSIPTIATLHLYAEHDLHLIGRAIGSTVEAAVVFKDAGAAQETLSDIIANEDIAEATILSSDGHILAHKRINALGWRAALAAAAQRAMDEQGTSLPVLHNGAVVGQVVVRGGGRTLLHFLGLAALGILACQILVGIGALYLSSHIVGRITRPLRTLRDVTGNVQRERAFYRRVPQAEIAELNDLGCSFNALLGELEQWQTLMQGEHQRLSYEASHDSLTGLANRAFFEGRLNRKLIESAQTGDGFAVLLIDCNRFKTINDTYGHAAGDAVLSAVASRLKGQCRHHDLVARLGGDEFAILISQIDDAMGLQGLMDAITLAMQMPITLGEALKITASLSIGRAVYPHDGASAASLLQRADDAMYRTKRASANRSTLAEPGTIR